MSSRRSTLFFLGALLLLAANVNFSYAVQESQPLHASGDKEVWDRKTNRVELFGHAIVRQPGETLTADHIVLDQNTRILDAQGNCIYTAADSIIYGQEMHFNMDSRTGTIVAGRVVNERFTLGGERINKLGDGRFQTHWGEYSTCRDCAQSWTLQAQDVDMEIEGYAYLSNVAVKVKDAPALWLPYLIVPMKTQRQSGLLFPTFSFSQQNGFSYVQPFFWAINRSSDLTIALGEYSVKGVRGELEGRYALSSRSNGKFNAYYLSDKSFADPSLTAPELNPSAQKSRWALDIAQTQELPFGIDEKLRLTEVSDDYYPISIGDVPGQGEKNVSSVLSFSYASSWLSAYIAASRYRNLLNTQLDPEIGIRRFDSRTVQAIPTAVVTTNDQLIFGTPVAAGLTLGVSNFTRTAESFSDDVFSARTGGYRPGIDPIREATRVGITPSLYTTFRPWDAFTFTPSIKYFGNFYSFHNDLDNYYRSYVLFQADLSAQLERIFTTQNPDRPRVKHLIRPLLTYSFIPPYLLHEDDHPFKSQIQYGRAQGFYGYNFDDLDIVPVDRAPNDTNNYFVPLGNSLAYGLITQLIERQGKEEGDASYVTPLEFSAGQAINFREYQLNPEHPQPLNRFFANLKLNHDQRFLSDTTYYYYPYISGIRHQLSTSETYIIERTLHQRILAFDRSLTFGYVWNRVGSDDSQLNSSGTSNLSGILNFSLSDYVLPTLTASYDFLTNRFFSAAVNIAFQNPSQCWRLNLNRSYGLNPEGGVKLNWGVDLAINLTGSGFGGASDMINQVVPAK